MLKKTLIKQVLILLFIINMSSCEKDRNIDQQTKTEIIKNVDIFLNDWHKAASEADFENYFTKMDSISVFIGTDASENWTKKEFMLFSKPYFDEGKAWDFKTLERNIYTNNSLNFIWFDELLDTWMGVCRGSGIIEIKNSKPSIKQYVLSFTVPNDNADKIIQIKRKKDSMMIHKLRPDF